MSDRMHSNSIEVKNFLDSLGINRDNLVGFTLSCSVNQFVTLDLEYHVYDKEINNPTSIIKSYELVERE